MAELKLALFDVDGTLIDSLAHIKSSMDMAFGNVGVTPPTTDAIREGIGLSLPILMRMLAPQASEAQLDALSDEYKNAFARQREISGAEAQPFYPGALKTLKQLHGHDEILLGIATGKSMRGLSHIIQAHSLEGYFQTLQTADAHPSKPHPSMVEAALAETGVEAEDAVMIGDTSFDLEMGRAAGVTTIGVRWGFHPSDRLKPLADHMIGGFDELVPLLNSKWGTSIG